MDARTAMEAALRKGLERHELRVHYQPQVDQDGKVIGAEALIRWLDADGKLIPPARFILLAEDAGLILPIGEWVLNTACAQLKAWESDPRCADLYLSVNVSARQFHQPDFVTRVAQCIQHNGANPARLKLDLTEGIVLESTEKAASRMS